MADDWAQLDYYKKLNSEIDLPKDGVNYTQNTSQKNLLLIEASVDRPLRRCLSDSDQM